jgi:uncharacterized protein (TIGR03437 family)
MYIRTILARRLLIAVLALFGLSILFLHRPHAEEKRGTDSLSQPQHDRGGKYPLDGAWDDEERLRELMLRHELNRRETARFHPLGEEGVGADVIVNDINDVSVIQDDGTLARTQNPFDLGGRAIQLTPSGNAYTITTNSTTPDTNLGLKLDLTAAPAVNPISSAEPGDDAYIMQDLGFNFSFYGATFTSVAVSSNGFLVFRPSGVTDASFNADAIDSVESLTDLQTRLPRIAPYWHDLDARASATQGANGIYFRRDEDRVVVTWNNIRDFPSVASRDTGVHRFQVTLFRDGRIVMTYDFAQLTSTALTGISPGNSQQTPSVINFANPPSDTFGNPVAEFFTTTTTVDLVGIVKAFYTAHPNRDIYDFVYFLTDFNFDLGGGAFAFYQGLSNDVRGINLNVFNSATKTTIGSQQIQGLLNLNNLVTAFPATPAQRMTNIGGVDTAMSLFAQEQGHRWLARALYTGSDANIMLGRGNSHWSYFFSIESSYSSAAARRSSSMEGSVWRDNGDGTFTTVNLIDGFSPLDQYLMGFRASSEVPEMFVVANPIGTTRTRSSNPLPNVTVSGTRQAITIDQIVQANGARVPDVNASPKQFRAAFILFVRQGTQPAPETLRKLTQFRLAWESYFSQAADFRATVETGLADQTVSRVIAASSAASFQQTLSPAGITALFGKNLTSGATAAAATLPLPTSLAGTEVLVNGVPAGLFFASPDQINFQVPNSTAATTDNQFARNIPSGAAFVEVISNGQLIRAGVFQIAPAVPAFFTLNQSGSGPAAAVDAFTGAPGPFNATRAGGEPNIISFFGTGLGADATDEDGNVNASVQVKIDGNPVTVQYAGRAPGFAGLNQFNVVLPAGISSGTHSVTVSRNGIESRSVTIAIK